jgi:hypothetical protein
VARERKAIVDGLSDSVLNFEEGVQRVDPHEVMALLMMTQYFDALRDIGAQSNTILLPHSPSAGVRPLHAVAQCHYGRESGRGEEYGEVTGEEVRECKVPGKDQLRVSSRDQEKCGQENRSRGR